MSESVLSLIESLLSVVTTNSDKLSPLGSTQRAVTALKQLHTADKKILHTDQLMVRRENKALCLKNVPNN